MPMPVRLELLLLCRAVAVMVDTAVGVDTVAVMKATHMPHQVLTIVEVLCIFESSFG